MARKGKQNTGPVATGRPSALIDNRVICCGLRLPQSSGNNVEQLAKLPDQCVDLIYIDPPFHSDRNYEAFGRGMMDEHALGREQLQACICWEGHNGH